MNCLYCQSKTTRRGIDLYTCTSCNLQEVKYWVNEKDQSIHTIVYVAELNKEVYWLTCYQYKEASILATIAVLPTTKAGIITKINYKLNITPMEVPNFIERLLSITAFS